MAIVLAAVTLQNEHLLANYFQNIDLIIIPLVVYGSSGHTSWLSSRQNGRDEERQCTVDMQPSLGERRVATIECRKESNDPSRSSTN